MELDSLSLSEKKRHKRKKKRKRKRMGGAKGVEDTSETASEIRSTTCTSTTECRDARRSMFTCLLYLPLPQCKPLQLAKALLWLD